MDIKQGIQDVLYLIITGILPLLITYGILFLKVKIKEQVKQCLQLIRLMWIH